MAKAQFVSERSALSNIEKGKWDKAKAQLTKLVQKDSVYAGAEYALARYFFSESNPDYQIDSAYRHIQKALSDFQHASVKEREKLLKIPVDSIVIVYYRKRIDTAAFERARTIHTEPAYTDFLQRFPTAEQGVQASALRDEVAFAEALKTNTYSAFLLYTEKYPASRFTPEAKSRYERLLFESKTADQKLTTYEAFLTQYPETPYRKEIEQQIFEKITAGGEAGSFDRFIRKYPASSKTKVARNILYHLLKEDERALIPALLIDSLRNVQTLEKHYLVPFLKDDRFGFMNDAGDEVIKPSFRKISDDYLCGNVTDELILADDKIITHNGNVLYREHTDEMDALGYGFMFISSGDCGKVLHVSGFLISNECLQDARLLAKNYLLLKKNKHWSVWTLTGRMLMDYEWDEIQQLGEILSLKKGDKIRFVKMKDLSKIAEQQQPTFSKEYDEVKLWNDGLLWVRDGNEQAVLNQTLSEWIKPSRQTISPTFFGALSQVTTGYILHSKISGASQQYFNVKVQAPWTVVQQNGVWSVVDPVTKKQNNQTYDSISFVGPFLVGLKGDSVKIHVSKTASVELLRTTKPYFIPGKDSLFFLMLEEGDKKTIYNAKAEKLFTLSAEKVEYNNEGYFTITQKQKKGLITLAGKIILTPEYDAVGTVAEGTVATLKDKKFGLVDLIRKKVIKPEYEKNIVIYDKTKLIGYRSGKCALIGWDNKPITAFEFEEILHWNDSSVLVKKNFNWLIYNYIEKRIVADKIKAYKSVKDDAAEKIVILQQENKYGVLSNTRGMVIPATFSDIVNVGSADEPLYFTEKHVEEASIFVVIYYDKNGVQLRKHVHEGDDYEKIYCSGK